MRPLRTADGRRPLAPAFRLGAFAALTAVLGGIVLLLISLGDSPRAHAATANVNVANISFTDATSGTSTTTIHVGDTVTWTWVSGTHSSCSGGPCPANTIDPWDSGIFATPHTFSKTFNTAGTFNYWCAVHTTSMTGNVVVLPPAVGGVAGQPNVAALPARIGSSTHTTAYMLSAAVVVLVAAVGAASLYAVRRRRN